MKLSTITFSADGTQKICDCYKIAKTNEYNPFTAQVEVSGTFGSGTLSFYVSSDGGTTKNTLDDLTGVPVSVTAAKTLTFTIPAKRIWSQTQIQIYATLSGSTNPAITINVDDNN